MNLPASLQFHVLPDLPMVEAGDDLAALLEASLRRLPVTLADGDVLVVAQKIVSKAEGRLVPLASVTPGERAIELAKETDKDPRHVQLVLDESTDPMSTMRAANARCCCRKTPTAPPPRCAPCWPSARARGSASSSPTA